MNVPSPEVGATASAPYVWECMMYVGDWMGRANQYWPENLAVVDLSRGEAGRFTYGMMNERANRLANHLREAGVSPGDRVALLAPNSVSFLDIFFACGKLGAIFVPLNWRLHSRELIALCDAIEPHTFIFDSNFKSQAEQIRDSDNSSVKGWMHIQGQGIQGSLPYEKTLLSSPSTAVSRENTKEEDIICLLLTGGTTGLPKAAQISHRMIAWNTLNTSIHELNRDDVTITHTPMFHTGALLVYTIPLLTMGGTVVIMSKWDSTHMLKVVEDEKVTMFFAVPTQYQQLAADENFASTDFSSVRFVTSGGAPLPVPVMEAFQAVHPVPFKQGFGMTEFGPGVCSMGPEFARTKAGSIGRPNFYVEAKLVDDDNKVVAQGSVGELWLRGPSMCSGYFRNPEATKKTIDGDGWFHTGDMAKTDEDGFYYIVDRKKDMFISGGENIYPAEIEALLYQHEAVAMCAVIGVPHEKWGEVGQVHVVLNPASLTDEAQLIAFMKERMARYKVPKSVVIRPSLPLSAAGKILKRELRK